MMLRTLTLQFSQVGKSKGLECVGVVVEGFIIVYGSRSYHNRGALGYKGAVREREVFQRLAHQAR